MNCDKNKEIIQLYSDGELDKNKEAILFSHLSECEGCRLFFRTLNTVSTGIQKEEFPHELETRIFDSISSKELKKGSMLVRNIFVRAVSFAAALFLLAASIFLYMQTNDYKTEMTNMDRQIQTQAQTIELLYNTLPPTVVHANYENEVIVRAKM